MIETDAGELRKRNRQQREINALNPEAKAEPADHGAESCRHRNGGKHAEPRSNSELEPQKCAHITAEPDIERMPERELAGKAHHQVPSLAHISEIENEDQHRYQITVGD